MFNTNLSKFCMWENAYICHVIGWFMEEKLDKAQNRREFLKTVALLLPIIGGVSVTSLPMVAKESI